MICDFSAVITYLLAATRSYSLVLVLLVLNFVESVDAAAAAAAKFCAAAESYGFHL